MVRLITQNLLSCPSRACAYPTNFPLSFRNVEKLELVDAEFNEEFMRGVLSRLEWQALRKSAAELGNTDLPEQSPDLTQPDSVSLELLQTLHHVLLEIVVADGEMVCPQCEHVFRIKDTIPNMLLAEHEIRNLTIAQELPEQVTVANGRILTSHRRKPLNGSGGLLKYLPSFRLQVRHLLLFLCCISVSIFFLTNKTAPSGPSLTASQKRTAKLTSLCPYSTSRRHIPTVILQGTQSSDRTANRTVAVLEQPGDKPAPFLQLAYPPRELRFAQTIVSTSKRPGGGKLGEGVHPDDERGEQLCKVHRVPSSPRPAVPDTWRNSAVMFGMSTLADRVLWNLPVWAHWLPGAPIPPLDPDNEDVIKELPLVLVLTPPSTADDRNQHREAVTETERRRAREAEEEANLLGLHISLRPREAERFETRYFALAEEMWAEAKKREEKEGVKTEWFVFADDDTFFPDFDSLARLLSSYDPTGDHIIGALSESTKQVNQWGHIAYGGAGIIVSHGLLAKMNANGVWSECLAKFGASFGGDAMVTHCAALAMDQPVKSALKIDDTLHQLDIRGDGTGFFQSGFLITSLHHWGSWFTLFPPWHESGMGDFRKGITLVGKAAKAVGGDNWGRRYVFEDGKVVVALGYSVTVVGKALSMADLDKSEHTWWEFETFHPIRPGQEEGVDKRTYYISGVRQVGSDGIFRLEHKNREGERVDLLWDQRAGRTGSSRWRRGAGGR